MNTVSFLLIQVVPFFKFIIIIYNLQVPDVSLDFMYIYADKKYQPIYIDIGISRPNTGISPKKSSIGQALSLSIYLFTLSHSSELESSFLCCLQLGELFLCSSFLQQYVWFV